MAKDWTGYGQYCPISRAADVLCERWTLLILRDMLVGATRFNDLARGLPGISRSLLTKRLRQLEQAELVERLDSEYHLTPAGKALEPVVFGIGDWGAKWMFGEPRDVELDPELLMWWIHNHLDTDQLPDRRSVLHFRFTDVSRRFWIVVGAEGPSVCLTDPGFDVDVTVTSDLASLYEVWLGKLPLRDAMRGGSVAFDGPRALTRRMPDVLQLSPVAGLVAHAQ